MSERERFEAKYRVNTETGCWEWTAAIFKQGYGYGLFTVAGKSRGAHRVSYELHVGPIPDGLVIDHLCRNPRCVNPAHLEAVTQAVNVHRGNGLCAQNARKTHCKRGHEFTPENTLAPRGKQGRECRACHRAATNEWRAKNREALNRARREASRLARGGSGELA